MCVLSVCVQVGVYCPHPTYAANVTSAGLLPCCCVYMHGYSWPDSLPIYVYAANGTLVGLLLLLLLPCCCIYMHGCSWPHSLPIYSGGSAYSCLSPTPTPRSTGP